MTLVSSCDSLDGADNGYFLSGVFDTARRLPLENDTTIVNPVNYKYNIEAIVGIRK